MFKFQFLGSDASKIRDCDIRANSTIGFHHLPVPDKNFLQISATYDLWEFLNMHRKFGILMIRIRRGNTHRSVSFHHGGLGDEGDKVPREGEMTETTRRGNDRELAPINPPSLYH